MLLLNGLSILISSIYSMRFSNLILLLQFGVLPGLIYPSIPGFFMSEVKVSVKLALNFILDLFVILLCLVQQIDLWEIIVG